MAGIGQFPPARRGQRELRHRRGDLHDRRLSATRSVRPRSCSATSDSDARVLRHARMVNAGFDSRRVIEPEIRTQCRIPQVNC